jgi:AcrR family transcriptional regulator
VQEVLVTAAETGALAGVDGKDDPVPASRRSIRKQELRSRISEAAADRFAERGIAETTIEDICAAAGVSRRTLYSYYPTKQDIVRCLCQSLVIDESVAVINRAISQHADVASRLHYLFADMLEHMSGAPKLQKELTRQLVAEQGKDEERDSSMRGVLGQSYTRLFETATGVRGLSRNMDAELSAGILFSVISLLSINWINDETYPLADNITAVETYLTLNLQ